MALALRSGLPVDYWLRHPAYLATALNLIEQENNHTPEE